MSKLESDDDNERDAGGFTYENAFDLGPEYGYGNLDRRHAVNGNLVLFLPWGFDFASGFQFRSGRPFDARLGRDANGDTNNLDRPYSAPGVPFKRNAFRNFSEKNVDLRLQKKFTVAGKHQLIVSAEAFNVFGFDNVLLGTGTNFVNYCTNVNDLDLRLLGPDQPDLRPGEGGRRQVHRGEQPGAAAPVAARTPVPLLNLGSPRHVSRGSVRSPFPCRSVRIRTPPSGSATSARSWARLPESWTGRPNLYTTRAKPRKRKDLFGFVQRLEGCAPDWTGPWGMILASCSAGFVPALLH